MPYTIFQSREIECIFVLVRAFVNLFLATCCDNFADETEAYTSHARLHHCVFVALHLSSDRLRIIIIRDFIFVHLSLDAFRSIASHGLSSCVQLNMRLYIIMSSRSACRAILFARASASWCVHLFIMLFILFFTCCSWSSCVSAVISVSRVALSLRLLINICSQCCRLEFLFARFSASLCLLT